MGSESTRREPPALEAPGKVQARYHTLLTNALWASLPWHLSFVKTRLPYKLTASHTPSACSDWHPLNLVDIISCERRERYNAYCIGYCAQASRGSKVGGVENQSC